MQKLRRIIQLALFTTVGLVVVIINPLLALIASIGLLTFVVMARQLNLYKIVMVIKRYAQNVYRLRCQIRARLHTGYYSSVDSEEAHHRSTGYIR